MLIPNLQRIIETHVSRDGADYDAFVRQLRSDVLLPIRQLQSAGLLRWFSFLQHPKEQLLHPDTAITANVFHLRLEPEPGIEIDDFMSALPDHFLAPVHRPLGEISGSLAVDALRDEDWAQAWGIAGASSEWLLCLLEAHRDEVPLQAVFQSLHYIVNPLLPGHQCAYIPAGWRF